MENGSLKTVVLAFVLRVGLMLSILLAAIYSPGVAQAQDQGDGSIIAPHRDTGVFEAARYGIDRLKEIVPVWKKEVGAQGEEWVEGDYIPKPGE